MNLITLQAGILAGVIAVSATIGAFCWPYAVNEWLAYFGKEGQMLWWHGALCGVCPGIGQASIPVAVITWIAMMFLI